MKDISHWLFDLDDTLYPASCGLFPQVSRRITESIAKAMHIPFDQARTVQRDYWLRYGTSLRGLVIHNHLQDPEPFLAYVHDVPIERYVAPDPVLRRLLGEISASKHVFTNSPQEYARRVLAALDVSDQFDHVFDIRHSGYVPKPDPFSFQCVLRALDAPAHACVLVDDAPENVRAARAIGMKGVWLRAPGSVAGGVAGGSVSLADAGDDDPADLVIERLETLLDHI